MLLAVAVSAALAAHSPVLVYDADERFPFAAAKGTGAEVYGREGPDGWLQYWLYARENPQDRGLVRLGRHAGDWELLQVRLEDGRPVEAVAGQHSGAERCGWSRLRLQDGHPVVYVANGSHALYFRPGLRDRTFPDPNDEADGRGVRLRPPVVAVTADSPEWMRFRGRWGGARKSLIPGESDSPRGPAFQGVRWDDPAAFAGSARTCAAERCDERGECDGNENAMGAGAALLLALLGWRRWTTRRTPS
jgi:hypothetical protein